MRKDAWAAMRKIVADRDGYKCIYCRVPTAATIEHLRPRSDLGHHRLENLALACPSCNVRRGNTPLEEWRAKKGWLLALPDNLPDNVDEMLKLCFKAQRRGEYVWSGNTNSRLRLHDGNVILQVRAGKDYPWHEIVMGKDDAKHVVYGCYDFLRRHHTATVK